MSFALKINPVSDIGVGDLIAFAAFVLGLWNLVRPWWHARKASLEVRSEEYRRVRGDHAHTGARFVVKNHGPARAREVEVGFFHDGQPVTLDLIGWIDQARTPLLHPGEEYHLNYTLAYGDNMPELVVVTWRDGRRLQRRQEFYPSVREL